MEKHAVTFSLARAIGPKPSVFDRLIREVTTKEIPCRFVDYVVVFYTDGSATEISGREILHPIPMGKLAPWATMTSTTKRMKDIKIVLNVKALEKEVNRLTQELLGKYR